MRVAPEPGSAFKKAWAAVSDHPFIREAVSEDNSFLAAIILRSARSHQKRGIWDLVFPDSEDDLLRLLETLAVQEPECSCHFSNFLVAESSGEPGAGLSGYDPASVSGVGQAQDAVEGDLPAPENATPYLSSGPWKQAPISVLHCEALGSPTSKGASNPRLDHGDTPREVRAREGTARARYPGLGAGKDPKGLN